MGPSRRKTTRRTRPRLGGRDESLVEEELAADGETKEQILGGRRGKAGPSSNRGAKWSKAQASTKKKKKVSISSPPPEIGEAVEEPGGEQRADTKMILETLADFSKRLERLEKRKASRKGRGEDIKKGLSERSGGRIGRRRPEHSGESSSSGDSDGWSSSDSDSDSDPESSDSGREGKGRKKDGRISRSFWARFNKTPFPKQTLEFEDRQGELMLMTALTDHPTVTAFVNNRQFVSTRNWQEVRTLAKAMDCMIDEQGIWKMKDSLVTEVVMRRLMAVLVADEVGNWDV